MNISLLSRRGRWAAGAVMAAILGNTQAQESSAQTAPQSTETSAGAPQSQAPRDNSVQDASSDTDILDALLLEPEPEPPPAEAALPAPQAEPPPAGNAQQDRAAAEILETIPLPEAKPETPRQMEQRQPPQQLEEIIVTATKREQSSREIPVSITALKGEDLERIGARDMKDYLMQSPGITLVDSEYGEARGRNLTVRGVGPGSYTGLGNQTMGQFIGDVPMTDPFGNFGAPDLDPFDLKTVEILRGPQGTTFGASALNGAIRYAPNEPELDNFLVRGFVDRVSVKDGGADQTYALAVNAPTGDQSAIRISGLLQNAPGLYDNLKRDTPDADTRRKWTARAAWRWEPTEKLSVNLMGLKQQSHVDDVLLADNPDGRFENNYKVGESFIDFGFGLASIDTRYRFDDWGTLVLQGNWQEKRSKGDVDSNLSLTGGLGIETIRGPFDYSTRGNSQELRLVSPGGGNWDWIVGVFRRDYQATVHAEVALPIGTVLSSDIDPLNARETAFYGELTRHLGAHWEVTAGARRYTTSLRGEQITSALGTPYKSTPVGQDESGISPKFSVTYKPNDDIMAYASVSRGFQFGGINTTVAPLSFPNPATGTPIPTSYDSSVLWNTEIGLRTDWLDKTLRLDLALFDIRWDEAQLQQQTGGQVSNDPYVDNVGKVRIRGAEGSFSWLTPLQGLSLNFNASYTDARTREAYDRGGGDVIPAGTTLPAVPKVQTTTTLSYNTLVGNWLGDASLNYAQWGPAQGDLKNSYSIFDFGTFGLTLNVARPDYALMPSLTLGISNLTDERGLVGRVVPQGSTPIGPVATWNYIRPRTISLRLTMQFD